MTVLLVMVVFSMRLLVMLDVWIELVLMVLLVMFESEIVLDVTLLAMICEESMSL